MREYVKHLNKYTKDLSHKIDTMNNEQQAKIEETIEKIDEKMAEMSKEQAALGVLKSKICELQTEIGAQNDKIQQLATEINGAEQLATEISGNHEVKVLINKEDVQPAEETQRTKNGKGPQQGTGLHRDARNEAPAHCGDRGQQQQREHTREGTAADGGDGPSRQGFAAVLAMPHPNVVTLRPELFDDQSGQAGPGRVRQALLVPQELWGQIFRPEQHQALCERVPKPTPKQDDEQK